jgi:VIT1/CCC1 family predicted Fe2+/Mn2+ transporter
MADKTDAIMKRMLKCQRDEETGCQIYAKIARREKNADNRRILEKMSADEKEHALTWKQYTKTDVKASAARVAWLSVASVLLGYTFVLKRIQQDEALTVKEYEALKAEIPEVEKMQADERAHENMLIAMLDEERLNYVGAMVLGLNDALVELPGAIAGFTFALADTRLAALSGIITGISATLSMAASNYLAEKADGAKNPMKSSVTTGAAYLVTVALLVLPYLLFAPGQYVYALIVMLLTAVFIILAFNYYIAVAKSQPFLKNFLSMTLISLSVALISFFIGLLAKRLLGLDI